MRNAFRALFIVVALSSVLALRAHAQPQPSSREQRVRAVVDSFYDAVSRGRYDQAASFIILEPFAQQFRETVRNLRSAIPRKATAEAIPFEYLTHEYAGVTAPEQLVALSPLEALARWLEAMDPRTRQRDAWQRSNCRSVMPNFRPDSFPAQRVRGVAFADDSTAYVILATDDQWRLQGGMFSTERLIALRSRGPSWRLEPRQELLDHVNAVTVLQCEKSR